MESLIGQLLGRYEVVGYLGAGGMGRVYRAVDGELGREVAIKVLPELVWGDERHFKRFRREASIVAGLSHPNILEIHDFGFEHQVPYAVTELLDGCDLRDQLAGGPLSVADAVHVGVAVAEGLGAAHAHGVVHRDIKPENIFITRDGRIKILDFGIARPVPESSRLTGASEELTLTSPRAAEGTVGYMSPEQVRGQAVDGRSDIFSLGCVLFEMLTGEHPFDRPTAADTISAILSDDPPHPSDLNRKLPPGIDSVVLRCLQKDVGRRFESARDLAFALSSLPDRRFTDRLENLRLRRRVTRLTWAVAAALVALVAGIFVAPHLRGVFQRAEATLPFERHVAVAPFGTGAGLPELSDLASGLGEILADDLAAAESLVDGAFWIVPPADARFMGAQNAEDLYRLFAPTIVLSGEVARSQSELRLVLSIIDPVTGRKIQGATVSSHVGNVSSLQLEPVQRVLDLLEISPGPEFQARLRARSTNVAQAFMSYVEGTGALVNGSPDSVGSGVERLQRSVSLDPAFLAARERLADALIEAYRLEADPELLEQAASHLDYVQSVREDPSSFRLMADLRAARGDLEGAAAALKRAAAVSPRDGLTFVELGRICERLGRYGDAETAYHRAMSLRPGYWPGTNRLAILYYAQGKYDAAANTWRHAIQEAPLCIQSYNNLGAILSWLGREEESRLVFERSIRVEPEDNYAAYSNLGTLFDKQDRYADAVEMFEKALAIEDGDHQVWGNYAYALVFSDQAARATEPFARAIELAEAASAETPDDAALLSRLAGYHVMIGNHDAGRALLSRIEGLHPRSPMVFAAIGETYEDLGERETALTWIRKALDGGVLPDHFEHRPMLRDLVADERFRRMVEPSGSPPAAGDGAAASVS